MCEPIRPSKGSSSVVSRTLVLSDSGQPPPNRFEPQREQNVFAEPSSGWYVVNSSSTGEDPDVLGQRAAARGPTPPESFLQLAQWHAVTTRNGTVTAKRTPPQRQVPVSSAIVG